MDSPPSSSPGTDSPGWDPHVIATVGLVCIIFLLFSYYKIMNRNCTALRMIGLSRRSGQRRRLNEHLEEFSSTLQSRGLDSIVMHSLPITQVKKSKEDVEGAFKSAECAVCLGEFEEGEWVKHLPSCTHAFHVACIDTWFQMHSSCPLCRCDVISTGRGASMQSLRREDFSRERSQRYESMQDGLDRGVS